MATVFVSRRRYRVAVNTLDHPPPHVHAYGKGLQARFQLKCPTGPAEVWDFSEGWSRAHLNELAEEITANIAKCCSSWDAIHG